MTPYRIVLYVMEPDDRQGQERQLRIESDLPMTELIDRLVLRLRNPDSRVSVIPRTWIP